MSWEVHLKRWEFFFSAISYNVYFLCTLKVQEAQPWCINGEESECLEREPRKHRYNVTLSNMYKWSLGNISKLWNMSVLSDMRLKAERLISPPPTPTSQIYIFLTFRKISNGYFSHLKDDYGNCQLLWYPHISRNHLNVSSKLVFCNCETFVVLNRAAQSSDEWVENWAVINQQLSCSLHSKVLGDLYAHLPPSLLSGH